MVLLMFFEALYFGHFLSFYTMQLEPPKYYTHPPVLKWIKCVPASGTMTRGALPWFVISLACVGMGCCMGLEDTYGPVLHPSTTPKWMQDVPAWGPMAKGALPWFVMFLARSAMG